MLCHPRNVAICRHFCGYHRFENQQGKTERNQTETIIRAQELIEHQISMAQEMARFLGDNTARGEVLMNKLIDSIKK